MKTFVYGLISCIFIFGILLVLYVLTGGDSASSSPAPVNQTAPASQSDSGFKDLKIN